MVEFVIEFVNSTICNRSYCGTFQNIPCAGTDDFGMGIIFLYWFNYRGSSFLTHYVCCRMCEGRRLQEVGMAGRGLQRLFQRKQDKSATNNRKRVLHALLSRHFTKAKSLCANQGEKRSIDLHGEEWPEQWEEWPEQWEEWPEQWEEWPEQWEEWPEQWEEWPEKRVKWAKQKVERAKQKAERAAQRVEWAA